MFVNKLRLLSSAYHRTNVVKETIRKTKINFPAITQAVRTYARFIDDDEDDEPAFKPRRQTRDTQSFGQRNNSFGERRGSYGNQGSFGQRGGSFVQRRGSFAEHKLDAVRYDLNELEGFKKNFYQPSTITESRRKDEIQKFRIWHEISVPQDAPNPIFRFDELQNLPPNVAKEIQKQNFQECTPIQAQGMPMALSGKNMVGIAQTG